MSRLSGFTVALLASVGMSVSFHASSAPAQAPVASPVESARQASSESSVHPVLKPGDRNCLRDTGSLIPPKKGACLPVNGRSYSGDQLRNTGTNNNARALQMLDPSISVGGH